MWEGRKIIRRGRLKKGKRSKGRRDYYDEKM
jgi:hypothetical protein